MSRVGDLLGRKVGPLPVGAWAVAILGGVGVAVAIRRRAVSPIGEPTDPGTVADTTTPPGVGNPAEPVDWEAPAVPAEAPAPLWAGDLTDQITDGFDSIGSQLDGIGAGVDGLYYVVPAPGGPGQGGGTGGDRRDTGTTGRPRPVPSVKALRDKYEDRPNLGAVKRQAAATIRQTQRGGVTAAEARPLAAAINRHKAAAAEQRERRQERRQEKKGNRR